MTFDRDYREHSISWKPFRFASWFPTLISCSPNLPRVYIRLCKHGNHFTFLQRQLERRHLCLRKLEFHGYSLVCNSLSLFRGNFSKSLNFSEGNLQRFDQRFSVNHLKREDNCFVYSKHPPFSFRAMLCLWDNSNGC